ncbi:hypothetical protein BO70DRAFT_395450 [Aspergillus heteromorphus CBS 117.55]|uniref:Protein kinase domain-containing protein n=1 Tax=Aspergillus heteromorphus CBS 117.55 TaxID=1448321 RepID=A0A317WHQ5_9EURO|nr:uncharacterized protein BO70DRAFT_395450 [Aspergillus heteromorphus CBS 117.55]PWY84767.1 hypothetical protein BO70DRAFT_395450 [Aspergillus heteromorphus CBS 117.55]
MSAPSEWTSALKAFPTSGLTLVDPSTEIEEETLPTYQPGKYYPVLQGDVLHNRYQAWDIVSPRTLFSGKNPDGVFDDRVHLAEMVALLGPPPATFRERSKLSAVFWDEQGNWKELAPLPDISLESLAGDIRGKDKEGFLRWLRAALQWNAEDRPSAVDLLFDAWMMEGLGMQKQG